MSDPACHPAPPPRAPAKVSAYDSRARRPLVALAGNPNTGKTTLFNRLTGSNARVGNYPGITVERTLGELKLGDRTLDVLDVPGTYSLVSRSNEEQIAIDALLGRHGHAQADLVVLVLDACNLERNLYMVLQVLELELPLILALNMMDAATASGIHIDVGALERRLGVPVVPVSAARAQGIEALRTQIDDALDDDPLNPPPGFRWTPTPALLDDLDAVVPHLGSERPETLGPSPSRAVALWALMSIDADDELDGIPGGLRLTVLDRLKEARHVGRDIDREVASARYAFIDTLCAEVLHRDPPAGRTWTQRLDAVLIHPVAGFAVFLGLMALVFQALFSWSDPAITLIETAFSALGEWTRGHLAEGILSDFLVDGLIGGVGSVLVFLPQIMLLFLFIGLLEDSGYMARAAFLMDRVMNKVGLHGRAFVPMLSGFACAVPAILATRTMERRRDRYLTMMVVPLMTCSARLPVYTLVIGALFPDDHVAGIPTRSMLMIGMYLFGTLMALVAAAVLGRTVLKGPRVPLLMELPPYRRPDTRSVLRMVAGRAKIFLREAGTVILICSIALWALLSFPRHGDEMDTLEAQRPAAVAAQTAAADSTAVEDLDAEIAGARLRNSYGGRLGHALEPLIAPIGFDWKIGVGLVGAFAAREVFVSTLGVVYGLGGKVDEESPTLRARMQNERRPDGRPLYSPLTGLSLLVFFALASQCMSTLAAVRRETGGWRMPALLFGYMSVLAWTSSFLVWNVGKLLGA